VLGRAHIVDEPGDLAGSREPVRDHGPVVEEEHRLRGVLRDPDAELGLLTAQRPLAREPADPVLEA
jgi:hypothetical protein